MERIDEIMVRRVVPSDHSCLFSAIGYVMEHQRNKATELRQVIAEKVASDPIKYTQAFLEVPNAEYCSWIQNSDTWGGAIELSILSEYYQKEIAAYHTDNVRCYVYGEDKQYTERVLLIYDGRHYDALALLPEEFDQTVFPVQEDRSIGRVHELALDLVNEEARNDGNYGNNSVAIIFKCVVCGIQLVGQKEVMDHADATNHLEFLEQL
ncbi:hypothetical protein MKW94_013394 [Papaver nudicaule]|uniref:Ubiquitin thioesterase OTU n=1 Tax=Papaver nudicaule TaxID=74823 RepID=A0AA41VG93_PAPNU|nr:hypothetical protein [Papaver nudicaule]